ncbi:hypothetical protein [Streptomyces sp. A1547]|uniref:hypothetical protein n=1 Tax=Streptomyces sp. A1547 TaxID=2563105 RepID=UPI00109EBA78|nr:hypothetical protein [Streptomyces sp. A1547]THA31416.1 hypothetical protein E6W17_36045 [Streptomyces sp. A1547]
MLINDEATRQVAETIGNALGVGFTLRNGAIAGGAAHIEYPDGRALGFRPIFGGAIVQLWIVGNAKPADEGEPPTVALREGQLYHASLSLIRPLPDPAGADDSHAEDDGPDDDPAELILEKFKTDLIPAFDFKPHYVGHRPWEDAFSNALAASIVEQGRRTAGPNETHEEPPPGNLPMAGEVREAAPSPVDVPPTADGPAAEPATPPAGEVREVEAEQPEKAPARPRGSRRRKSAASSTG